MNESPPHPTDEEAHEEILSRVPTRDIGPHPIVADQGLGFRGVLHPVQEGQMDPGGMTLSLDVPVGRDELERQPVVRELLSLGWRLVPIVEGLPTAAHWTLVPADGLLEEWMPRRS